MLAQKSINRKKLSAYTIFLTFQSPSQFIYDTIDRIDSHCGSKSLR